MSGEEEMTASDSRQDRDTRKQDKASGATSARLIGIEGAVIVLALVAAAMTLDWYVDPQNPETRRNLVKALAVDTPLRLLEIIVAWPVILLVTHLLFRRARGEFIRDHLPDLLSRIKTVKGPGGIELDFGDAAKWVQDVVNIRGEAHGNDPKAFRDFVVEQINKLPRIAAIPSEGRLDLHGSHLLWVDDNPSNNIIERNIMDRLGATTSLATSTEDALEKARQKRYDVIISDMGPREYGSVNYNAGYDLLDKLQEDLNTMLPFIIYAGWKAPRPAEAKQRGAFGSTNDPQRLFQLVSDAAQSIRIQHSGSPVKRLYSLS